MSTKKDSPFYFNEEKIEIVNNYAYLGIRFSESAFFTDVLKLLKSNAYLAIGSATSLIYKLEPYSW